MLNAIDRMNASVSTFSKTDRRIYEAIRKFPENFAHESISKISDEAGFTKPALTRFAKRIGFSGFAEFQYQLAQDLEQVSGLGQPSNAEVYGRLLIAVEEAVGEGQLGAIADRMLASPHVYLYGSNLSALPAQELYIELQFVEGTVPVLPQLDTLPRFLREDLVIVYSAARGDAHRALVSRLAQEEVARPYMLLVTTNGKHGLRRRFDEVVVLPTAPLAAGRHSILSDTFAFLMFNDLLSARLAQRRHQTRGYDQ